MASPGGTGTERAIVCLGKPFPGASEAPLRKIPIAHHPGGTTMTTNGSKGAPERPPRPSRPWIRSRPVRTMFRPGELEDLKAISEVWGVPVATVVWAIVADQLARCRRRAPELGQHGLAIAVGLAVTRLPAKRHPSGLQSEGL